MPNPTHKVFTKNQNNQFEVSYPETVAEAVLCDGISLSKYIPRQIFGVALDGDKVQAGALGITPFKKALNGFVLQTDFAELQNNGSIKILKAGLFEVNAGALISDGANQGNRAWHCSIHKNGIMVRENFGIAGQNTAGMSASAWIKCAINDLISLCIVPEAQNNWRLSAQYTNLLIRTIKLD